MSGHAGGDATPRHGGTPGAPAAASHPYDTCGSPAVITATAGCAHEHIHVHIPICQYHVDVLAAREATCGTCADVDGHDCPLTVDIGSVQDLEHPDAPDTGAPPACQVRNRHLRVPPGAPPECGPPTPRPR